MYMNHVKGLELVQPQELSQFFLYYLCFEKRGLWVRVPPVENPASASRKDETRTAMVIANDA